MLIYKDTTNKFVQDINDNRLTELMIDHFLLGFGKRPGESEINSWQHSLPKVKEVIRLYIN